MFPMLPDGGKPSKAAKGKSNVQRKPGAWEEAAGKR